MTPNRQIEAGAGTGKTTRLVKAVLEALLSREIPIDSMVALTFTNKAAGELKERVHSALVELTDATEIGLLRGLPWWPQPEPPGDLSRLKTLARAALESLDRADVSTIHSFAFALLKRFPVEAGINPQADIDDSGLRFDELFKKAWKRWLTVELAQASLHREAWLKLLKQVDLADVETTARRLADFAVPLDSLPLSDEHLSENLKPYHEEARALLATHSGSLKADRLTRVCEELIGAARAGAWEKVESPDAETRDLLEGAISGSKSWNEADLERLKHLRDISRQLVRRGDRLIALMTELLHPFLTEFRSALPREGVLTHTALLSLAWELVRDHREVRETLKNDIRMILIDEFQDTDPLQAELLLFLAEKPEKFARRWQDIDLSPGKLFIVGDPKQSIYRFRGADMTAYDEISRLMRRQGAARETLDINYRSQSQIIEVVNQAFERLITAVPDISPPYAPVIPRHAFDPVTWPIHNVELWLARSDQPQSVTHAQAAEAEAIAEWIESNVGKLHLPMSSSPPAVRGGSPDSIQSVGPGLLSAGATIHGRPITHRDIALIFRTYSPMDVFIQALRRRGIPFAVESERFFFTTPEVTDFINLLRLISNPEDAVARVGFLRSPMGGMTDEQILHGSPPTIRGGDGLIQTWSSRLAHEPLAHVLHDLFENTFLLELAARSYHGEQTLANLTKLRRLLEDFCLRPDIGIAELLERLDEFFEEDSLEGENPLADESFDAVRILTVHKAKGLEFPVVFLPSLHSGRQQRNDTALRYEWRSGAVGLAAAPGTCNLAKLELDAQARRHDAAEEERILYVAMTRARQRLILSGGIHLQKKGDRSALKRLGAAWSVDTETLPEGPLPLGTSVIQVRHLPPAPSLETQEGRPSDSTQPLRFDPEEIAALWTQRRQTRDAARQTPLVIQPSRIKAEEVPAALPAQAPSTVDPVALGSLLHRFLQRWDFGCKKCDMPAFLRRVQPPPHDEALIDEAQKILARFIGSPAYEEIAQSTILGREIPFFYGEAPLVRGTIDVLYRRPSGEVVLADYKSDRLSDPEAYRPQLQLYAQAVEQALGEKPTVKLIYLRSPQLHKPLPLEKGGGEGFQTA